MLRHKSCANLAGKNVRHAAVHAALITGVMNVRGEIVTVLDTKMLFAMDSPGMAYDSKSLSSTMASQMGFLVDE